MRPDVQKALKGVLRKAWFVWIVMFCSLPVALIACYAMADDLKVFSVQDIPLSISRNILLVSAAILFIVTGNIRRFQLHAKSIAQRATRTPPTMNVHDQIIIKYLSVMIISLALSEVIGVFGVLLFILSGDFQSLYLFIAISAAAMLLYCPKWNEIQGIAIKMDK